MNSNSELIQDIIENIELLESTLLECECVLGKGSSCGALVHILFRYAHNSKGAFGTLGDEDGQRLVHHMEALLDLVRSGKGELSQSGVDNLLRGVSLLLEGVPFTGA